MSAQAVLLAEAAEPGQILIGRPTRELAVAAIETERAGPDRFVLQSAQEAVRPLALRLDVPLVGRDEELRQLAAACARGQPRTGDHAGDGDRRGGNRQDAARLRG